MSIDALAFGIGVGKAVATAAVAAVAVGLVIVAFPVVGTALIAAAPALLVLGAYGAGLGIGTALGSLLGLPGHCLSDEQSSELLGGSITNAVLLFAGAGALRGAGRSTGSGGSGPVRQGQAGVNKVAVELESQGYTVQREVTFDVKGTRVRPDIVATRGGDMRVIEVKTGPSAGYTTNQRIAYPQFADGAIARGANAEAIGLVPGRTYSGLSVETMRIDLP
jgi:hypothetical protein